jgi:GNAT superfamily N-acetyltransferase
MLNGDRMIIQPLTAHNYEAWLPLWQGYQTFYKAQIPAETTAITWQRFHDPGEPVYALGAFEDEQLVGIVHYLFHRSTWTTGPYCYLQDLFTLAEMRGKGVGRALINAVYDYAREAGASRVYWLTHETNSHAMILYDQVADKSGFVQYRKSL